MNAMEQINDVRRKAGVSCSVEDCSTGHPSFLIPIPSQSQSRAVIALRSIGRVRISLPSQCSIVYCRPDPILSLLDVDREVLFSLEVELLLALARRKRSEVLASPCFASLLESISHSAPPLELVPHESIISLLLPLRVSILDLEALLFVLSISCQC